MMRKLLNILYVTNPDAYLTKDGENIVVRLEDKEAFRTPVHYLEGIVMFSYLGASPAVIGLCLERGISISLISPYGKHLANINGMPQGNVLLRRKQYRLADSNAESARLARLFVIGKITGCRTVLRRFISDHDGKHDIEGIDKVCKLLARNIVKISNKDNLDEIRGIEGESARAYFSVFNQLILNQKNRFFMAGRNRRPPKDNVNALLSFLYTLLLHETKAALVTVGLDPYVGFLHRDRPGRLGLALDLMEEFRPYYADRLALSLINRQQIKANDFIEKESGGIILKDAARKIVLEAWQKRKVDETTHPFLEEKIPLGLLPYSQALLLARHLRGDMGEYPPFLWK
jgi:CRISP-associated protein Cas1